MSKFFRYRRRIRILDVVLSACDDDDDNDDDGCRADNSDQLPVLPPSLPLHAVRRGLKAKNLQSLVLNIW